MTLLLPPRRLDRAVDEPSGVPAFPRLLLAGVEKAGKTYEAALASNSDLVGTTYWLELGEDSADEYKQLGPYRIVRHDGSYMDFLDAVRYAVAQPRGADGKPNLIVVDSASMLWELLCDEQTAVARRRATERGAAPDSELTITADQWQKAKNRFKDVINTLKYHDGPVLITARLEDVVLFDGDKPTRDRAWKVKSERSLPFECTAVVQLRARDSAFLTGVRSLNRDLSAAHIRPLPGFNVDKLFRDLGMDKRVARSTYRASHPEAIIREQAEGLDMLDDLPDDPSDDQLTKLIMLSFGTQQPEYLHRLTAFYGHQMLSRRKVAGKDGPVSAADAIERALNALANKAGTASPQPPSQAQDAFGASGFSSPGTEQPRCTVPDCPTPKNCVRPYANGARCEQHGPRQDAGRDAGPTAEEHQMPKQPVPVHPAQMLRDEAAAQARVLGLSVDKHLAELAPPGSTASQLPPTRLGGHLLRWRPVVVTALRDKGHDDLAEQYAKLGTRVPTREAAEILNSAAAQ
ncbi:AAA family ATPase [Streptomyces sp. MJM8645]|uniref:AAA family ATPase n=1 Tax=Streptomyces sp. MJM8645 TaxID=1120523 RepID=UPI0007AF55A9|nr:AAA family ATPase [Streptomyces sp. MJM8645]